MKRKIMVLLIFLVIFSFDSVHADNELSLTTKNVKDAIVENAEAYYRKGTNIQYDRYRTSMSQPEEATRQNTIYNVCSYFTYNVFYNTLGIKIPVDTGQLLSASRKYVGSKYTVLYLETEDNKNIFRTDPEYGMNNNNLDNIINKWKNLVQIGDIIVIQNQNKSGHAMLVSGFDSNNEPYLIDSSTISEDNSGDGGNYHFSTSKKRHGEELYETKGAMRKRSIRKLYEYYRDHNVYIKYIGVLRIIHDDNTYVSDKSNNFNIEKYSTFTDSAKTRMKYKKMDIEKTSTIDNANMHDNRNSVSLNDLINYKIIIKNNSNSDYKNVNVREVIDEKTKLINSGNGIINNNTLNWKLDVPANGNVTISYTVKVKDDKKNLKKYITSVGYVDNIKTRVIDLYIMQLFTKTEQNKIINSYNRLINNNTNEMSFISSIYKDSLNIDLSSINNKTIDSFIKSRHSCTDKVCEFDINDELIQKIVVPNYYGLAGEDDWHKTSNLGNNGFYLYNIWDRYNVRKRTDKARDITIDDLQVGDILLIKNGENSDLQDKAYIYIDGKLVRKNNQTIEEINDSSLTKLLRDLAIDNYILLRPSQLIDDYTILTHYYKEGTIDKLADDNTDVRHYGDEYETNPLTIIPEGYELVGMPSNASGIVDGDKVIIYHYKLKDVQLTVKHLDEENNLPLVNDELVNKKYGQQYETKQSKNIPENYKYVKVEGNTSGIIKENTTVTYYYKKKTEPETSKSAIVLIVIGFISLIVSLLIYFFKFRNKTLNNRF